MALRSVPITLDRERQLRIGHNEIARVWDEFHEDVGDLFDKIVAKKEVIAGGRLFDVIRPVRILLWAALVHEDPKLTLDGAGELMNLVPITEIIPKIIDAFFATMEIWGLASEKKATGPETERTQ